MAIVLLRIHIEDFHPQIAKDLLRQFPLFFSTGFDITEDHDFAAVKVGQCRCRARFFRPRHRVGGDEIPPDKRRDFIDNMFLGTAEIHYRRLR